MSTSQGLDVPVSTEGKFPLGRIVATPNALRRLAQDEILRSLACHHYGDWGTLTGEDREANDRALADGSRILSSYETETGVSFWIITEHDRSVTTILLPEDY